MRQKVIGGRAAAEVAIFLSLSATKYSWSCMTFTEAKQMSDAQQAPEHWVPFTMPGGRYIVVQATINGHETEMIVDSAAGDLVLSASFASRLGLQANGAVMALGVTGQALGGVIAGPKIALGSISIHPK